MVKLFHGNNILIRSNFKYSINFKTVNNTNLDTHILIIKNPYNYQIYIVRIFYLYTVSLSTFANFINIIKQFYI